MRRARFALVALLAAGLLSVAVAADKVVGVIWEVRVFERKNGERQLVDKYSFRATRDLKVYKGANQIGTYTQGKDKVSVTLEKGKMAGNLDLLKTRNKPVTYEGHWTKSDGTKRPVTVVLVED